MKHAQKMVLIPENEYMDYLAIKHTKEGKMGELKAKTKKILKGEKTPEAAKQLTQIMGQYLRHKESKLAYANQKQAQIELAKAELLQKKKPDILSYFAPTYHQKVKTLLMELRHYGTSFTEAKELVLSTGEVISGSNIVDLLKEALIVTKQKKRTKALPIGWIEFLTEISNINIPQGIITKKQTLRDLDYIQGEEGNVPWAAF